jgi:3-dehydroquinate synthetase
LLVDRRLAHDLPDSPARRKLIENILGAFKEPKLVWKSLQKASDGLSHSEIAQACIDAIKLTILRDEHSVETKNLLETLHEKTQARQS